MKTDKEIRTTKARAWYEKHKAHVDSLVKGENASFAPSGSDCDKPELWKSGHWNWFLNSYGG
jgi:hypothetical protein